MTYSLNLWSQNIFLKGKKNKSWIDLFNQQSQRTTFCCLQSRWLSCCLSCCFCLPPFSLAAVITRKKTKQNKTKQKLYCLHDVSITVLRLLKSYFFFPVNVRNISKFNGKHTHKSSSILKPKILKLGQQIIISSMLL